MNSELNSPRPDELPAPAATKTDRAPDDRRDDAKQDSEAGGPGGTSDRDDRRPVTVVVRGETVPARSGQSTAKDGAGQSSAKNDKKVSAAKVKMQARLPALDDDGDIGVQKDQVVVRDGKADLAFTGTLLASAAPTTAPDGHWEEYRVYETSAGKHVFSKITRHVAAEEQDEQEAEIFDPSPSSMPSQLLRSARELTRSRPLTWRDAAVSFFGYDPLAKALYRKLGDQFEEHIG